MPRSLEDRITDLEDEFLNRHPGSRIALDWYTELTEHKLLNWVFKVELVLPRYMPKSVNVLDPKFGIKINWDHKAWARFRLKSWKMNFWTRAFNYPNHELEIWYQGQDDPNIPCEEDTKRLFGHISASIPIAAFNFVDSCRRIRPNPDNPVNIQIDDLLGPIFTKFYLLFLLAESRARYWRGRIGKLDLMDICLPDWANTIQPKTGSEISTTIKPGNKAEAITHMRTLYESLMDDLNKTDEFDSEDTEPHRKQAENDSE